MFMRAESGIRERVVLVDEEDRELGAAEKLAVHADGRLHRAFSVFVFNGKGQLLLQRRAATKYHSGGSWANTCCGHPRPFEPVVDAAHRRLREEMGFDCPLQPVTTFLYKAPVGDRLVEHEFDHLLVGRFEGRPVPHPSEVDGWCWMDVRAVSEDVRAHPGRYAAWFPMALERLLVRGLLRPPETAAEEQPAPPGAAVSAIS